MLLGQSKQPGVLSGVYNVQPVGQDCDGATAGVQRSAMGNAIDTPGQAADHGDAVTGQVTGQCRGGFPAVRRGTSGSDHGHGSFIAGEQTSFIVKDWRRVGNLFQPGGIIRVMPVNQPYPRSLEVLDFSVGGYPALRLHNRPGRAAFNACRFELGRAPPPGIAKITKKGLQAAKSDRAQVGNAIQSRPELYVFHESDSSTGQIR